MFRVLTYLAPLVVAAGTAVAQSGDPLRCEAKGRNGMVLLLVCPDDLDAEALALEGEAACNAERPCGAWVWTSPDDVPSTVPPAHDQLEPADIARAKAIWVDEDQQLIILERADR